MKRKIWIKKQFFDKKYLWWRTTLSEKILLWKKNIERLQNAVLSSSHRLSRCQVVLTKKLFSVLLELELSEFEFEHKLSFGAYHNLSFVAIWVLLHFEFLVLSQFKLLSLVTIWVSELPFEFWWFFLWNKVCW